MGIFDLLFGRKKRTNAEVTTDRIWMTKEAKFQGVRKQLEERTNSETRAIFLVAHFRDTLIGLESLAQASATPPIKAVLASDLVSALTEPLRLDESSVIDFIVAERHPLLSADEEIVGFASFHTCQCRFTHHVSLDDALLSLFSAGNVKSMLKTLGMTGDDCIESEMVTRRIRQAQKKIQGRVDPTAAATADSADQWLRLNCPELVND